MRNRFVGRGILDASMAQSVRGRQGCRPLRPASSMVRTSGGTHRSRPTSQKTMMLCSSSTRNIKPPSTTPRGVGTAALGLTPQRFRHLRMAVWDDREFRWLRPAGVSPRARGDQRPCLWTPRFFEKNRVKLLSLGAVELSMPRPNKSSYRLSYRSKRRSRPPSPDGAACSGM